MCVQFYNVIENVQKHLKNVQKQKRAVKKNVKIFCVSDWLVHCPVMGGLLHLVHSGEGQVGRRPTQPLLSVRVCV